MLWFAYILCRIAQCNWASACFISATHSTNSVIAHNSHQNKTQRIIYIALEVYIRTLYPYLLIYPNHKQNQCNYYKGNIPKVPNETHKVARIFIFELLKNARSSAFHSIAIVNHINHIEGNTNSVDNIENNRHHLLIHLVVPKSKWQNMHKYYQRVGVRNSRCIKLKSTIHKRGKISSIYICKQRRV